MLRVLIAGDEQVIAESLALILSEFGYQTMAVYSGEEAVAAAGALKPDVVISDVMMGDLNGIDAGIQIRLILPECRVILVSGQPAAADIIQRAMSDGHQFEFLAKPLHPKALLAFLSGSVRGTLLPKADC
jgi:CheY-like chemotaxis protein